MKVRVLLLSFLGCALLFGCKKNKPSVVHEPDMVVKQDSFQHIVDSLHYISTAHYKDSVQRITDSLNFPNFVASRVGSYAGGFRSRCNCYTIDTGFSRDTLIVYRFGDSLLVSSRGGVWNPKMIPGRTADYPNSNTDFSLPYYSFYYGSHFPFRYNLYFPKTDIDSVTFIAGSGDNETWTNETFIGVKIH